MNTPTNRDTLEAAKRIIAWMKGEPGADDCHEYVDAVACARALLAAHEALDNICQLREAIGWDHIPIDTEACSVAIRACSEMDDIARAALVQS